MPAQQNPASASSPDPAMLEKENAELRATVAFLQTKLQLVGSITRHDVLNQMTAIMGYNELLGMMIEDPKLKSFLEKERQAIDKIRRQFGFAKDFQNIAAAPPRWQNIRNLSTRVSENFDLKGVRIIAETGSYSVLADPELDKVFHHIFENALIHGQNVTEIKISLVHAGSEGVLILENNGVGIPNDDKNRIFERGYGKGTGWGLFLAREILAVTGMTIAETGVGGSSVRFEIRLPAGSFRENGAPPGA
jgi:signal transduction histidine kinase